MCLALGVDLVMRSVIVAGRHHALGIKPNAVNFAVSAGQCLSSGKDVAAVMFWMTHCGLIERR